MIFRFGVASTKFYYNNETDHDTIKCIMDDDYPEIITNIILKITNNLQYDIDQKGSFVKTSKSLYLLVPKVTGIIKLQGDIDYGHGFIDAQITLREDDDGSLWTKATYLSDELEDRFETDDLSKQNTVTILTEINDDNGPITTIREKIQEKCQLSYKMIPPTAYESTSTVASKNGKRLHTLPYRLVNEGVYRDYWKVPSYEHVLEDITGLNLKNVPNETVELIKSKVDEAAHNCMMELNNVKDGLTIFTNDENGFRMTEQGRDFLIRELDKANAPLASVKLPRGVTRPETGTLVDMYNDNPLAWFDKVGYKIPLLKEYTRATRVRSAIKYLINNDARTKELRTLSDYKLNTLQSVSTKQCEIASISFARRIFEEAEIPLEIKEELLDNAAGPNAIKNMRNAVRAIKAIMPTIYFKDTRLKYRLENDADPGIIQVNYTASVITQENEIDRKHNIMFEEDYSFGVESTENAFAIFVKHGIKNYIKIAAEHFGVAVKGSNVPIPAMGYNIRVFDKVREENGKGESEPIAHYTGDDITAFSGRLEKIVSGDELAEVLVESDWDSSGYHEVATKRQERNKTFMGCRIYLVINEPIRNRVATYAGCFLPGKLEKMMTGLVDIPKNMDDCCFLDSLVLWARRQKLIGSSQFQSRDEDKAKFLKKNRELLKGYFIANEKTTVYDMLIPPNIDKIFVDGITNNTLIDVISDAMGQDIAVYRLVYEKQYTDKNNEVHKHEDLSKLEPKEYAFITNIYNTRDRDEVANHPTIINLLIFPNESNVWNPVTFQMYHDDVERKIENHHIGYINNMLGLIKKLEGMDDLCYCDICGKYFSHITAYKGHLQEDPKDGDRKKCPYAFTKINYHTTFNNPKIDAMNKPYILGALDFEACLDNVNGTNLKSPEEETGIVHIHHDFMNRLDFTLTDPNMKFISDEDYEPRRNKVEEAIESLLKLYDEYNTCNCEPWTERDPKAREKRKEKYFLGIKKIKDSFGWNDKFRSELFLKYFDSITTKINTTINYGEEITDEIRDKDGNIIEQKPLSSAGQVILKLNPNPSCSK